MLEDIKKGDIKKVNKVGDKIIIELGSKIEIDEKRIRGAWESIKRREVEILAEKEKISKIAEMAKIKLE
ncbi:hypothetical protein LCGC14_2229450 [marine sediment metagenome]|uniref:Uncharacterized protein n=1 Tax=marine sediment metagenome TaxID=412755 RepID=A0A0F9D8L4_9ZZZZ